jgi:transposase
MKKATKQFFLRLNQRHVVIHEWFRCRGVIHRVQINTGCRKKYILKWVNRYLKTRTVNDLPRGGRPRLLNPHQAASIAKSTEQHDSVPAAVAELQKKDLIPRSVTVQTARRAVKSYLQLKAPRIRPVLTDRAKAKRLAFCKRRHAAKRIVAVDSTIITGPGSSSRHKVWTKLGITPVQQKVRKGQQVHVYAGITRFGATPLVRVTGTTGLAARFTKPRGVEKYRGVGAKEFQQVLRRHLLPEAKKLFRGKVKGPPIFLLDGAPAHRAAATINFMRTRKIQYLKGWPPNSPDLNPIENLWAWLKRHAKVQDPKTAAAIWDEVCAVWQRVDAAMCRKYMGSFNRRKRICISKDGGYTGY